MGHESLTPGSGPEDIPVRPGAAVRLTERLWRVTCANAGLMTGPGTNSYLIVETDHCAVIDPGPHDPAHLATLHAAAPGPIRYILVTHTHPDHSPGAVQLQRLTGAQLLGRLSKHTRGQDRTFSPDRELADGDMLALGERTRLRVYHTPGHASNHLCYLLEPERLLFTGDHIIQGSTVVIDPPDGDMSAYLTSLRRLLGVDLSALAPGHGRLIRHPHEALRALIAHRLSRESRVYAALDAQQPAALATILERAYEDVPQALHALAERSLLAHLLKLEADGRAGRRAGEWVAIG